MAEGKIFVGRKAELEQFKEVLKNPKGQAVLVVGQAGMGKTWLVNEVAERMENKSALKCFSLRYEVTPTDPANTVMTDIMNDAADAIDSVRNKARKYVERNKQKLAALFGVGGLIPIVGSRVKAVGDLLISLTERDKAGNVRKQFIDILQRLSNSMPDEGRVIFIIDPEKYMQQESDYAWGLVVDKLPSKIKFVFPQRPEDVLVQGEGLARCNNIVCIPEGELKKFDEETIEELVSARSERMPELIEEMRTSAKRSDKTPYSVTGTLELIAGAGMKAEELAQYLSQEEVARAQWRGICNKGKEAKKLFEAYAILEVGVPDDVVNVVSGLKATTRKRLQKDSYLKGLLREEGEGKRIYHAILADYILGQIGEDEQKEYHSRAVEVYRGKLEKAEKEQIRPDALAATRLAEHVLLAEGKEAFVDAFVNECTRPLINLGLLDTAISLSEWALGMVGKDTKEEGMVTGNLGLIYRRRGDLAKAEDMHNKSLEINKKLGRLEGMANQYTNLGVIYETKGDLDKAEDMHNKSLEINKKLGRLEGMANQYGNLGLIYRTKGDLEKAEEMFLKILKIHEKLSDEGGMSKDYTNLGLIYETKGDLDKAEDMHNKSLEIAEKLDNKMIMASAYGNLGLIYRRKGDLDKAEEMHKKSLEIAEKLDNKMIMASAYGNLGLIYRVRGDLAKAEDMHNKSLEIEKKLGRLEGMASEYGNLGLIYRTKGDLDQAEDMHKKSLEIEKKLGRLEGMAADYGNLGVIYEQRGDIGKAREYWEKAVGLYKKIGMPHMVEKVEGWIRGLENWLIS